jgi:predicted NAD-dependent protein-ADP-ribosyltransferase YbiA (DUF1768 family)
MLMLMPGMGISAVESGKPGQWEGENVLDELLMRVREELS